MRDVVCIFKYKLRGRIAINLNFKDDVVIDIFIDDSAY